MINKLDITGNNFTVPEDVKKYAAKRLSKLDRYLPRNAKKDVVLKVVITEIQKENGRKYEISTAMDIPGGKVMAAKGECSNLLAGIDIVETKLVSQISKFKTESTSAKPKKSIHSIFKKQK